MQRSDNHYIWNIDLNGVDVDQSALATLMDWVALVLADDQLDLPVIRDVKRDWSKWRPEGLYDALFDDEIQLDPHERHKLEEARENHINRVVSYYVHEFNERQPYAWRDNKYMVDDQIYEIENEQVIDMLQSYGGRDAAELRTQLARAETLDVHPGLIADIARELAEALERRDGLLLWQYDPDPEERPIQDWFDQNHFDDLIEGLSLNDLEETFEAVSRSTGETWNLVPKNGKVRGTVTIDFGLEYFVCVTEVARLVRRIYELCEERQEQLDEETGGIDTQHFNKPIVKDLPPGATADQLALLRMFELRGTDQIPSQELRKLPMAKLPYVKDLLDRNKVLTPDIVKQNTPVQVVPALRNLQKTQQLFVKPFKMNVQVIWDLPNNAFIVTVPLTKFEETFGMPIPKMISKYVKHTNHPNAGPYNLTIGWVRFTEFDNDLWIDEIQSDLSDKLDDDRIDENDLAGLNAFLQVLGGMTAISRYITEQFIKEMRSRGYEKFYLPNMNIKKKMYHASPPVSIYEDLPKKLRMQQVDYADTPLGQKNGAKKAPKIEEAWELSRGWMLHLADGTYKMVTDHDDAWSLTKTDVSQYLAEMRFPGGTGRQVQVSEIPPNIIKGHENSFNANRPNQGITGNEPIWVLASSKPSVFEALASRLTSLQRAKH